MKKVKGFHFDVLEDEEILNHIEKQGNQSQYIKDLVKNDIKENDIPGIIRKEVDRYLKETADMVLGRK